MPHVSETQDDYLLGEMAAQLERARQWSPHAVDTLTALVAAGEDLELFRINPIQYARQVGIAPGEAIDLFLHAVKLGMFEMDWQVVCDTCGGVTNRLAHLEGVHSEFECPVCTRHGPTMLDDVIRVSFTVSPRVRKVVFHHPDELTGKDLEDFRASHMQPPPTDDQAFYGSFLSGKRLLTTQTFRNLFRSEVIGADEEIGVRDITVMFTDLKGSTQMYDKIGDPNAFYLVRQHFDTLRSAVTRFEGATIKTMGDAVMATFMQPPDGLLAALDMMSGIDALNRTISESLILKIGLHRGHSIAVTLDERQDFFGQTVNIAARVQGLAGSGEIYITQAMAEHPGVPPLLEKHFIVAPGEAALRGISEKVRVYRLARRV
jgi:class 3 adenylate cyclase